MKRKYSQLTSSEKKSIQEQLNNTKNMKEFLMYLAIVFDLEKSQPGITTKQILSNSMINVVLPMINPEIK